MYLVGVYASQIQHQRCSSWKKPEDYDTRRGGQTLGYKKRRYGATLGRQQSHYGGEDEG